MSLFLIFVVGLFMKWHSTSRTENNWKRERTNFRLSKSLFHNAPEM